MISKSLLSYCIYLYKTSLTFITAWADKQKIDKFRGSSNRRLGVSRSDLKSRLFEPVAEDEP